MPSNAVAHPVTVALAIALVALAGCTRAQRDDWPNGNAKHVGQLVDGKQSGSWTYAYQSGARQAEGTWRDDRQDGAWRWWYEDGAPKQEGRYAASLRVGTWSYWYPNGSLYCRGDYQADHQIGPWIYYHPDGRLAAIGSFDDGAKVGGWRWWRADGSPQEQGAYWDGRKVGPWTTWSDARVATVADQGCPPGADCYREPATGDAIRRWGAVTRDGGAALWLGFDERGALRGVAATRERHERFLMLDAQGEPQACDEIDAQGSPRGISSISEATTPSRGMRYWRAQTKSFEANSVDSGSTASLVDLANSPEYPIGMLLALHAPLAQAAPVAAPVAAPDLALPEKDHVALTPMAILPIGFWTKREEANAGLLIEKYVTGRWPQSGAAGYGSEDGPHGGQRYDLQGKPLTITRLLSSTGDVIDLDDYKGRKNVVVVVLRGFAGQVCVYCATQTAALAKNLARFEAADTQVVLVYPGAAESVPVFIDAVRSLGVDQPKIPIALDVDLQLVRALKISHQLAKPTSVVIDKRGDVRYAYVGETRADRPSVDDLLRAIQSLSPAQ